MEDKNIKELIEKSKLKSLILTSVVVLVFIFQIILIFQNTGFISY